MGGSLSVKWTDIGCEAANLHVCTISGRIALLFSHAANIYSGSWMVDEIHDPPRGKYTVVAYMGHPNSPAIYHFGNYPANIQWISLAVALVIQINCID